MSKSRIPPTKEATRPESNESNELKEIKESSPATDPASIATTSHSRDSTPTPVPEPDVDEETAESTASNSKDPSSTPDPQTHEETAESVGSKLREICLDSAEAFNNRDIELRANNLYKYCTPESQARFWNYPEGLPIAEHGQRMRKVLERFPEYRVEVISVTPEVFAKDGTAVVYAEYDVLGAPPGVRSRMIQEFKWRKEEDGWMCFYQSAMKGIGEIQLG